MVALAWRERERGNEMKLGRKEDENAFNMLRHCTRKITS